MRTRRLLFFVSWILSLAAITCFGGAVSYGLFFGITLLPVVSLVYIACVSLRFKIYQEVGSRSMVCGQPESYFFVLQNEDRFAFTSVSVRLFSTFSYVEEMPGDVEYELLPGARYTYQTRLVCRYRGEYEVGIKEVVVTDFLRLFRISYANPSTVKVRVLPKIVRLPELRSINDLQLLLQRETASDMEPDILVRDYVYGDPLKQIHWKATAREQKLKIRTRTGNEKQNICIFLDTARFSWNMAEYLPLESKLLETLLALGFYFSEKDTGCFVYYEQDGPVRTPLQGIGDFEEFYCRTAELAFTEKAGFGELLEQTAMRGELRDSKAVFLVLHELNAGIMETAGRLAAVGTAVVIYMVADSDPEEYLRQCDDRRRIVPVPVEAELEGVL